MSKRKQGKNDPDPADATAPAAAAPAATTAPDAPTTQPVVSDWKERTRPVSRAFPGPRGTSVPMRVAMERRPYADVIGHAKESLDKEICGVLVGEVGEDDDGLFIHVQASVRGASAQEGAVHVTYTQETWNGIHEVMERDYPRKQIVGWYHSHPGFGVEFSEMDLFIQKNFFAGPTQFGLLTDPLGGAVAALVNTPSGPRNLDRFWVDSREQRCQLPRAEQAAAETPGGVGPASQRGMEEMEVRLSQLIRAVDDLRNSLYRFLFFCFLVVGTGLVFWIGGGIYASVFRPRLPPEDFSFAPVAVSVDGKPCLFGFRIVKWQIPDELLPKPPKAKEDEADQKKDDKEGEKAPAK